MDQRVAVDAFERRARQQRRLAAHAEHGRAFDHQERPQPFSAAEGGISHGVHQPLRPRDLVLQQRVGQQPAEQRFGIFRGLVESLGEVGRGSHQERAPVKLGWTIGHGARFVNYSSTATVNAAVAVTP